ncbi:HNH endonuclease [Rarobacter faecitabidus]|uniref:HNH endonuclease n=1 Tax=Rarobacter faecitabidus TaxID=13243 RepID=UPI001476D5B7
MVRARRLGAVVIEPVARDDVFSRDGHRCQICGERVNEPTPFDPQSATVDHIIPLSMGGEHSMRNVQTACLRCNSAKQDRISSTPDMRRHELPSTPGDGPRHL